MKNLTMDKLVALCKGRGFVFSGSEIYGGLANTFDYGPLGVELYNNIKKAWWQRFITEPSFNVGVDCGILMNSSVWEASGHVGGFSDPMVDCKGCKARHRADDMVEKHAIKHGKHFSPSFKEKELSDYITNNKVSCPNCGGSNFTKVRSFNLMFKTQLGVTEESAGTIYLRPETAQGIFVNFMNVARSSRQKIPFGIGQIGKAFRNEITPGNFVYRTVEFEQMELEFFVKPGTDLEWFEYWLSYCGQWLKDLGIKDENLRIREHKKEELSHYSKATSDYEFLFPFGWGELWGIADRTDYDLLCHQNKSGKSMEYTDPITNEKYVPYCIEPSVGVGRLLLAFLVNAYDEEVLENDTRTVLRLHPFLAPYKAAILPLQKDLNASAEEIFKRLSKSFSCAFDTSASIGKRYRRQDEIGTPYCITVDYDTAKDNTVTLRDRDSMQQIRLKIDELESYIRERINL